MARKCLDFIYRQQQQDHRPQVPLQAENCGTEGNKTEESNDGDGLVPLVINLIHSPGQIRFNAEVSAVLRVSDGALLVVDAVEGKAVQTKELLIEALNEGITPVLMLNKVDRLFIQQFGPEEIYDSMQRVVDDINIFIAAHQLNDLPDQQVSFENGFVCFGSGYFGWSCSIDSFLHLFQKAGSEGEKRAIRKPLSKRENFIRHIIKPIMRMHHAAGVLPSYKKDLKDVDRLT